MTALIVVARTLFCLDPASLYSEYLIACKTGCSDKQCGNYYQCQWFLLFLHFYHLKIYSEKSPNKCITGTLSLVEQLCYRIGTNYMPLASLSSSLRSRYLWYFSSFAK